MPQNKQNRDSYLRGSPGYRTRSGRSGLDPIDTYAEAAYVEGVFLVRVFKFQVRTRNPFYLLALFVFGVVSFPPLAVLTIGTITRFMEDITLGSFFFLLAGFILFGLPAALTGALAINFVLSILEIVKVVPPLPREGKVEAKRPEKNHPKRRKDYR